MKSYQDHLKTLLNPSPTQVSRQSSAIFPIFFSPQIRTKLCFLNYWLLKRDIAHLKCTLLLRDVYGNLIMSKEQLIHKIKAYEINLSDLLSNPYPFQGSIEIQFSSKENLVFPYPAVVVVYEGEHFCSFVHSAQRILNKSDSTQNQIIESGFNIYATKSQFPFITLINGPHSLTNQSIKLTAINQNQNQIARKITVNCSPYQTQYFNLKDWKELQVHLNQKAGCLKAELFDTQTFPRLIVGNYDQSNSSMSVTHTYYDLTSSQKETDYWNYNEAYYPLTLMLPLKENQEHFSNIYFYPIYSPSQFFIDAEIYNEKGQKLKTIKKILSLSSKNSFCSLNFKEHVQDMDHQKSLSVRLIAYPKEGEKIPARIKVGFDMGFKNKGFPCNICTNFSPANPSLENKKQAFRWTPFMKVKDKGSIWCFNDSPKKEYVQDASIQCHFYRLKDEKTFSKSFVIPPHGHLLIQHTKESEDFFEDTIGWCTFKSDNPYISTYYFSEHSNCMIGGDHGF